ncbi:hypothetical protein FDECE_1884 [Fusarium decemcellulare]|nr:hypothetical protein FDECE_1884 [Fusarium decemcellulare]
MDMDTFPEYRLSRDDLLKYLKKEFPEYSDQIEVEKHGAVYRLTIPDKLTKAQRTHIKKHVCRRPDTND